MAAIRERLLLPESGTDFLDPALHHDGDTTDLPSGESCSGIAIDFDDPAADRDDLVLTSVQKQTFRADIAREQVAVRNWFGRQQWLPDMTPDLNVEVSARFQNFKIPGACLVRPARPDGISELSRRHRSGRHRTRIDHVYFPNANRFLAEGLALWIQAEIGSNPAFPNFGKPLHALACEILADILPEFHFGRQNGVDSFAPLHLSDLDMIATPSPLTLTVGPNVYGEEPRGQRVVYAIAGSFATFLIATHGVAKFREIYMRTPLRPQACDAGTPDRWLMCTGFRYRT